MPYIVSLINKKDRADSPRWIGSRTQSFSRSSHLWYHCLLSDRNAHRFEDFATAAAIAQKHFPSFEAKILEVNTPKPQIKT